ncbi:S8 family serine peptidase [Microbispora cellulosiformans]|uniref:S8 family serine peptidase n=1 Tax=Microbispora cellulosiformans TaxID=2614688 RepID=A0A5J5K4U2_9ACTN|nr:S8 family serine peptidase [Microbispora cellulosiformans]KAA9379072.1 S8 family serine peptidase [Microbispora cellulosiformans]
MTQPPWRRERREQFPGVPAWSLATSRLAPEEFGVSRLEEVTREWAWGDDGTGPADGAGVRVCVLDTGVDASHPLVGGLERSLVVAEDGDGLTVVDCDPADPVGHGTACAGLIRSIAPAVSLTSVRVLTDGRSGSGAALLAGLRWAVEEGFDLVNLSLSTTRSQFLPELHELADRAYFRRCLLVAAAHNMPVLSFPWTFSSVISVASHDEPDPMTYYYNPAPPAEFYARGVKVRVAWRGGRQIRSTGNSFAAPHITGMCALALSRHRWMTPFQLKSVLYLAASNVVVSKGDAHVRA